MSRPARLAVWRCGGVAVELAGRVRPLVGGTVIDGRATGGAVALRVVAALALAGGPVRRDEPDDAVRGATLARRRETALRAMGPVEEAAPSRCPSQFVSRAGRPWRSRSTSAGRGSGPPHR